MTCSETEYLFSLQTDDTLSERKFFYQTEYLFSVKNTKRDNELKFDSIVLQWKQDLKIYCIYHLQQIENFQGHRIL